MFFLVSIFLSAFLLFQVQPLIAKVILPYFGGGSAVWTACLLFFQAFLLLGYLYAHLLSQLSSLKKQALVHGCLLAISLVFLPIGISNESSAVAGNEPLVGILSLLSFSIGLPYLLLSSTGPLVQRWFSLSYPTKQPYQLYSLSNLASLLALLSFPFIFEPLLTNVQQSTFWSMGFAIYCAVMLLLMVKLVKQPMAKNIEVPIEQVQNQTYKKSHPLLWLALSTIGVVLLVSTTNAMTQNIPPMPFLWILPLCLYLLTFIISFHSPKWYVRWYWFLLFIPTALIAIFMFFIGSQFDITSQVVIYSSILFSACMICHGELARLKPEVSKLTWYYLTLAFGGFLGSVLVAFVAQNVFSQFLEFPLAIIAVFILFSLCVTSEQGHFKKLPMMSYGLALLCILALWQLNKQYVKTDVHSVRNFYGILSVKDVDIAGKHERRLIDGTTSHGTQSLSAEMSHIPMSYYRENTGVALVLEQFSRINKLQNKSLTVGLIGLGAGTLAAYGNEDDHYYFYELNPAVVDAAQNYFTYLKDSKANIAIVIGDGRVSLASEQKQNDNAPFDVLVIDAFSGDSIPQHLLTVEAMDLYWQRLSQEGAIAVHISNTHLNLLPLMQGLAQQTGKTLRYFKTKAETATGHDTQWVMMSNNHRLLNNEMIISYQSKLPKLGNKPIVWTDDFSDLFSLLK